MLHQRFTQVHLLITHLANLKEDFQLSFTTKTFISKQHKVVCNQFLQIECDGPTIISLKVANENIKVANSNAIRSRDTLYYANIIIIR